MGPAELSKFLEASKYIDVAHAEIVRCAADLAKNSNSTVGLIDNCFCFVRDEIKHSLDFELDPVTSIASDVLRHGTGYCYAKSHLLAALLRANQIPAGLCYQRLTVDGESAPFCLHGLNAVYLQTEKSWIRLDPRGNRPGVDARFNPPTETLAFPIVVEGEAHIPYLFVEPLALVTDVLDRYDTFDQVADNLPDLNIENFPVPNPLVRWLEA